MDFHAHSIAELMTINRLRIFIQVYIIRTSANIGEEM